jgi:hypothetical protein
MRTASIGTLLVDACASAPAVPEHFPATDPAPTDRPTVVWTKEMGQVQLLGSTHPQLTEEFFTTAKQGVRYRTTSRCVITVDGLVRGCVIEESTPSMDRQVLRWLGEQRYTTPAVNGERVQFSFLFTFSFVAGRLPPG